MYCGVDVSDSFRTHCTPVSNYINIIQFICILLCRVALWTGQVRLGQYSIHYVTVIHTVLCRVSLWTGQVRLYHILFIMWPWFILCCVVCRCGQDKFVLVSILFIAIMTFWHGITTRFLPSYRIMKDYIALSVFSSIYIAYILVAIFLIVIRVRHFTTASYLESFLSISYALCWRIRSGSALA